LIGALDAGLAELYPPEQRFGANLKAHHLEAGRGAFVVARDGGRAVGCGAIRLQAVLAALEAAARQLGVRRLVLETGVYQDAALVFYRRAGFTKVDCWGEYASSPTSICMEKHLQGGGTT
jgi:GNAT superfamily N-acetyltransferase